jgi:hypothetical protein
MPLQAPPSATLPEAGSLGWNRERASEQTLRRDGRRWTAWTTWVVLIFSAPGVALLAIEPLAFPVALLCFAHAIAVPALQARRGARAVVAMGSEKSAASREGEATGPERIALGLLADLAGRTAIDAVRKSGLAPYRGEFGFWLVGEQGAYLVRRSLFGRRVFSWCVRVGSEDGLPAADRVAHLLLALREDEAGFATVANLNFSGAAWRLGRHLAAGELEALRQAR